MTIYKIKYIPDIEEDYYLSLNDAIDAGNHYIDRIAEEESGWDSATIAYAKNYLNNTLEFKGVVKIKAVNVHTHKGELK